MPNDTTQLKTILSDAISDFSANGEDKEPSEWLQQYLGKKLPEKSIDVIHTISDEIIKTLDLAEEKKASLNRAIEQGKSAETWFAEDTLQESGSNGEKARKAAEFFNGIAVAEQTFYDNSTECELIDTEGESWQDEDWNHYRVKDSLKEVATEAGKAGLREIASDIFVKASEEGIGSVFSDSEFVQSTLEKGALTGLKIATSAGLTVAEESGFLPPSTIKVLAATAHKTIESLSAFGEVIRGRKTLTEAIVDVKNTAVSTFRTMWEQHGSNVLHEINDSVCNLFGVKGAVVSGLITGLFTPAKQESGFMHVIKETGRSVVNFLKKERHIPILSSLKKKLFS